MPPLNHCSSTRGKKTRLSDEKKRKREKEGKASKEANLGLKPRKEEGDGGGDRRQAAGPGRLFLACHRA